MKYTKKYNQKRKPKTHKKRPNRKSRKSRKSMKSRKHGKKGGRYIPFFSTKKDVETKQQQLNAFKRQFLDISKDENNIRGIKSAATRGNLIFGVDNIIGKDEDNIFIRFNDLYNELRGPTLECSNKKYKNYDNCQIDKIKYYKDLSNVLLEIDNKLKNTELENEPEKDEYRNDKINTEGLTKVDEHGTEVEYVLTDKDRENIVEMEKQIMELKRDAVLKMNKHGTKSTLGNYDEKRAKEVEKKRIDALYDWAAEYKRNELTKQTTNK